MKPFRLYWSDTHTAITICVMDGLVAGFAYYAFHTPHIWLQSLATAIGVSVIAWTIYNVSKL